MKAKKNGNRFFHGGPKNFTNFLIIGLLLLLVLGFLSQLTQQAQKIQTFSYSQFIKKVEESSVKNIYVSGQDANGELRDGSKYKTVLPLYHNQWDYLNQHHVEVVFRKHNQQLLPLGIDSCRNLSPFFRFFMVSSADIAQWIK